MCAEPCSVLAELRATSKGGVRLAKTPAYRVLLGVASSPRRIGARSITVKPSGRLVGKAKKLTVQLRVVLTDARRQSERAHEDDQGRLTAPDQRRFGAQVR